MNGDYAKHAVVWDWDGYDNTAEYDYWCNYAGQFGNKVLIPMCALGQVASYMAQKGYKVTAFDITKEMIYEGRRRFMVNNEHQDSCNLALEVADICDFSFDEKNFDFAFLATQDLNLLTDITKVSNALLSIGQHLRKGACLSLELTLPGSESYRSPRRTFQPRVANYKDKKVWKDSESRYDAKTRKHHIDQIVYVEDNNGTASFDYGKKSLRPYIILALLLQGSIVITRKNYGLQKILSGLLKPSSNKKDCGYPASELTVAKQ